MEADFRRYTVRDRFEIAPQHGTGHAPGVVLVLDQRVDNAAAVLPGRSVAVLLPADDRMAALKIESVRDHLSATSLFFSDPRAAQIWPGSSLTIDVAHPGSPLESASHDTFAATVG